MRSLRAMWLFAVVLAACTADSQVPASSGRGGLCSEGASVTREEIEAGGVLCEHQTLVASLRPGDDVKLAFHVFTPGDVDLCFEGDDDEPHQVSLGGRVVTAKAPCQTVSLASGEHVLGLRHSIHEAAARDSTPDVVHTKWTPPANGRRGRLLVATNACPGCVLTGPWPSLGSPDDAIQGYVGDYTGATIKGTCPKDRGDLCVLGGLGVPSSFDNATIVLDARANAIDTVFGDEVLNNPVSTRIRNASVEAHGTVLVYNTDASGTKFSGVLEDPSADAEIEFDNVNLRGADLTGYRSGEVDLNGAELDAQAFSALLQRDPRITFFIQAHVTVTSGQSFANLTLDGYPSTRSNITIDWPRDAAGLLTMNRAAFDKATLRHLNFGCLRGGDLQRATFSGATLENVSLTGCDLTGARFNEATLTSVTASKGTLLTGADLTNVTIRGLDVSDASLSNATLKNAVNKPAIGLVARRVTAAKLVATGLVTGLDGKDLGADFSGAILPGASFASAQLPRALFTSTVLKTTDFSDATLPGANFDAATGLGPIFERAHLESSGATRTSMFAVRFGAPKFGGAFLGRMKLTEARVCGGQFLGADLRGADLTGTLLPLTSDQFSVAGSSDPPFDCVEIADLPSVTQDPTTVCPNGQPGPCNDAAWVPPNFVPKCVAPKHRASGFACETGCDCKLLQCISGKCA